MTASLDLDLSSSEREAIEEMKRRVSKDLPRKVYDEAALYYRFLKARDFDVDAAETMLRNTLQWRKDNNIDKILTDYKRPEALAKYLDKLLLGYDKEGCPYFYIAVGKYDVRGIHMAAKYPDIEKAIVHVVEEGEKLLDKQSKKLGKTLIGFINIIDVDGLTFGNATYKKGIETVIRLLKLAAR
ncbi:protein real-time [Caerostris darwini]|uniref:Protein real-time n=1 Tax=Caerostris darwini TaxID=1538125 RepID=A0AAV4TW75_9ARAC|nr:protein real-time [Caerostris darwini]